MCIFLIYIPLHYIPPSIFSHTFHSIKMSLMWHSVIYIFPLCLNHLLQPLSLYSCSIHYFKGLIYLSIYFSWDSYFPKWDSCFYFSLLFYLPLVYCTSFLFFHIFSPKMNSWHYPQKWTFNISHHDYTSFFFFLWICNPFYQGGVRTTETQQEVTHYIELMQL